VIERLLRDHFVRRFLDNEFVSPEADRHDVLATVAGVLIAGGLFLTITMGGGYLSMFFQSPGRTAVPALDDRFFLFGLSMILMALAALAGWNGLSLDARDIGILGPLPIARRTIAQAKLSAVAVVASAFAVALNGLTSVLFPVLMVAKLPIGFLQTGALVAAHALTSLAAGAFGFLIVLAVRELLHAALGTRRFARVSGLVHAGLAVVVIASLLLLPGLSMNVAWRWLAQPDAPRWALPPLWFVGLHDSFTSEIMMRLPHRELPRFIVGREQELAALYVLVTPAFAGLARLAAAALLAVAVPGVSAHWWNNRRIEGVVPIQQRARRSLAARLLVPVVSRVIVRHPAGQAGFWLAWHCVTRSLAHRLSMAVALACGIAALTVGLPFAAARSATASRPLAAFAPQLIALAAIAVGFRRAIDLPADLRANWMIRLAWLGGERHYVTGVRRFALAGMLVPAAVFLVPVHAAFMGVTMAAWQALLGTLVAALLLQALMLGHDRLPFAAPYDPSGKLTTHGPAYLLGGMFALYGVAWLERAALEARSWAGIATFSMVAASAYVALAVAGNHPDRLRRLADFDALPEENTQRLGLTS
jgi:hypothetical protein